MVLPPKHKLRPKRQHSRHPQHNCMTTGELHPAAPLPSLSDPQSRIHSLQPLQLQLPSFPPNSECILRNEIPEDQRDTMTHPVPSLPSQPKHIPLPTPSSLAHSKQLSSSTNRTHISSQLPLLQLSPSGSHFPAIFLNTF
ncbi:hypothetical protein BLNAU_1938 [Blattamonas nauphoetae]|uniref:Uncharacterized protein n=1 Tax=Blattamonas nauphoetae TaxID=2049346 RepID=A0ABQ9YGY5_9EUKA|nr:hypothetical protein BLNAU_1938 [Blattamonas nauphoetae]